MILYPRQIDHYRKGPVGAWTRSLSPWCRDRPNPGECSPCKSSLIALDGRKDWLGIWNIWNGASRRGSRIEDLERHDARWPLPAKNSRRAGSVAASPIATTMSDAGEGTPRIGNPVNQNHGAASPRRQWPKLQQSPASSVMISAMWCGAHGRTFCFQRIAIIGATDDFYDIPCVSSER